MTGAKNPYDNVFWNDIEHDEKLKACSWAARGLWLGKLLPVAARSVERGVIILGDEHPCVWNEDLPTLLAIDAGAGSPDILPAVAASFLAMLTELVKSGAASVDAKGRIYNRRMVKARQVSEARSQAGKTGAAARWQTDGKHHGKTDGKTDAAASTVSDGKQTEITAKSTKEGCEGHGKPMHSSLFGSSKKITTTESVTSGARADDGAAPPKPDPKGTRLPDGWRPEGELRQWTLDEIAEKQSGVSAGHELERFRDHWSAQPGAKGRKSDWPATWRNWIRKAIEMEGKSNGLYRQGTRNSNGRTSQGGEPTVNDGIAETFARRSIPPGG